MGWLVSDERVPIEGLACLCSGTPHADGDTVWLRAELGPDGGFAAMRVINEAQTDPSVLQEKIGRVYAEHGIVDWTFQGDDGEPLEVSLENIRLLKWDVIYPIAQKGDDLYAEALLRPLVEGRSKSSRNGHTARSTSPKVPRTSTRQKR